jgi:hypothetical protein
VRRGGPFVYKFPFINKFLLAPSCLAMPPKPAAPAEAGSKQVKPKQKKAPAPKKTQPIDDIDCTAGKFSAAGSAECDDCAAGKFSATIGATLCDDNDCTAGKFSTAGSAECDDDCAAGKFSATIGAMKAKAVDYKSTIEAQWNTAAWREKGHEEFDLQQVQKRAHFKGLQAPAVLSVASPSSSSSSSVSYGYGEFRRHRLLLTRHIDQKDRKRAPCYDQAKADVADIAAGDKTFRSDVDLAS